MLHVIALLEIAEPAAFRDFESHALEIAQRHGGILLSAFAPDPAVSTAFTPPVDEIHVLQFPDAEALARYRRDPDLQGLANLRERGVRSTRLLVAGQTQTYTM